MRPPSPLEGPDLRAGLQGAGPGGFLRAGPEGAGSGGSLLAGPEGAGQGWPLFAYGTLQPGESRWPLIADLVGVVGPATTRGRLVTTPMGWPAATFVVEGVIHGTLLRPRGPAAARELWRITDRVEDAGHLFLRCIIRVRLDSEVKWAGAYTWNRARGEPPGQPVSDGRWRSRRRSLTR